MRRDWAAKPQKGRLVSGHDLRLRRKPSSILNYSLCTARNLLNTLHIGKNVMMAVMISKSSRRPSTDDNRQSPAPHRYDLGKSSTQDKDGNTNNGYTNSLQVRKGGGVILAGTRCLHRPGVRVGGPGGRCAFLRCVLPPVPAGRDEAVWNVCNARHALFSNDTVVKNIIISQILDIPTTSKVKIGH